MKPKIVSIVGPTASGKSDLALALAKKYKGEIICADSRTIYKGLDIGTAKPYLNSQFSIVNSQFGPVYKIEGSLHYMLDVVKPDQTFTVAQFQEMTYQIIEDILKRGKLPFLVGGTGLYIDAVTKRLLIPRVPPNPKIRARLEKLSNKTLWNRLKKLDAISAGKIDPKNKRRIIRALEVCLATKRPFSEQRKIKKPPYDILILGIKLPREKLYQRINKRVDKMLEMGFIEEVKNLLKKGYSLNLPSMSGLGYKQMGEFLIQNPNYQSIHPFIYSSIHLNEVVNLIKRDTRHFARRQISWFKRNKSIKWVENKKETEKFISEFLTGLGPSP